MNSVINRLEQLAGWLGKDGLVELTASGSLSKQVLDIFDAVTARIPKRLFLARWYPKPEDGDDLIKANLRLNAIRRTLDDLRETDGVYLELVDMGSQTGGTFPIHPKMYEAIASSDIILVDLTGVRPNVCVETGYALKHHEQNRLIFIFQPTTSHSSVPFDLNTFRYERFDDTGEISEKIQSHILEILRGAAVGT